MGQNTQLATVANQSIDKLIFDDVKLATIATQICKGGTPAEIEIFIATCEQRGLNPFAKQIYFIKYNNSPAAHVVSIDGLRLIADRTGRYAPGQKASYLYDDIGALMAATAYVKKRVGTEWIEAAEEAYYEEYVQLKDGKPRDNWKTMPRVMLSKCAEARALRRAFPEELSGLYAQEELDQAGNLYEVEAASTTPEPPQGRQKAALPAPVKPEETGELIFTKGPQAGKKPDECETEFLQAAIARWDSGTRVRSEMRAEVERVLAERYQAAMDAEESAIEEAEITEADVTEPIEAEEVEAEPIEAAPDVPKPRMTNAVKSLIMAIERAGLPMDAEFRAERLRRVNEFLVSHGNAVSLTSFNELTVALAFKVRTEIEAGKLVWGPKSTATAEAEDAE